MLATDFCDPSGVNANFPHTGGCRFAQPPAILYKPFGLSIACACQNQGEKSHSPAVERIQLV